LPRKRATYNIYGPGKYIVSTDNFQHGRNRLLPSLLITVYIHHHFISLLLNLINTIGELNPEWWLEGVGQPTAQAKMALPPRAGNFFCGGEIECK
jgi:hypothetical protein